MNKRRRIYSAFLLVILIGAIYTAMTSTTGVQAMGNYKDTLENVRDYTPVWLNQAAQGAENYAIDGGYLYVGAPNQWRELSLPPQVIASAVAVDPFHTSTLYVGAANELAIYLSRDSGNHWERIPFDTQYIGGVTDLAINGAQRTLYVATDTAGIFRLRDVGTSMIVGGHTMFDEAVLEVVADQLGAGLIFARTQWTVYHGVNNGQQWLPLDGLNTVPTALAVANAIPATVYIGTTDRGLLQSTDGVQWHAVPNILAAEGGLRLQVSAVTVDPVQPQVVYAAMNYLFGGTTVHQSPVGVAMTVDGGTEWRMLAEKSDVPVVALFPVVGETGAVFALTTESRTPLALGNTANLLASMPATPKSTTMSIGRSEPIWNITFISWLVAAMAAATLTWFMYQEWQQPTLAVAHATTTFRRP